MGRFGVLCLLGALTGCSQVPGGLSGLTSVELDVDVSLEGTLDFGTVLAGESKAAQVVISNQGLDQAAFRVLPPSPPLEDGVRLEPSTSSGALDPQAPITLVFELTAPASAGEQTASGSLSIAVESLSGAPLQLLEVSWGYRISRSGLVVEPNPLVLGPVAFGATVEGSLTVRNASPEAQDVYSLDRSEGQARFSLGAGAFEGLPAVDPRGVWTRLEAGESTSLPFRYTAPPEGNESKEEAIWRIGFCDDPACQELVRLEGIGANLGPDLVLAPDNALTFPRVPLGAASEFEFVLVNRGSEPVRVTSVSVDEAPEAFLIDGMFPRTLGPGESYRWRLRFEPLEERVYNDTLRVLSDDPQKPEIDVALAGSGVDLPPCQYSVVPEAIDFPRIPSLEEEIETVTVQNIGDENCLVFDVRIEEESGVPQGTYTLPDLPIPSTIIEPNGAFEVRVSFRPREQGEFEGALRMGISNEDQPNIVVPLDGTGGEGLGVQCSSNTVVTVGEGVRLGVFENATAEIVARRWQILSGPPGGANADDIFDPEPPTTAAIRFTPKIIGLYVLEAKVDDAEGRTRSCEVEVDAIPREFQITLTWDGPGDLDLHVLRDTGATWFDQTDDCFFQNPSPGWASPGLDNDEDVADGPENIRIDQPAVGETYRIAVHNFENGAGRRARVQVYCGNQSAPVLDRRSRRLTGAASGACTSSSDFWRLAEVTFTGPGQCTVDVVDDYITGSQACTPGF